MMFAMGWARSGARQALALVAGIVCTVGALRAAESCGGKDEPCTVPLGTYHAAVPAAPLAPGERRPAVVYFHGAGGSGASVVEPTSMLRPFLDRGYVVVGANGLMRPGNAFGPGWSFRPEGPQQRDELAFARQVLDDIAIRFAVDRERILLTGFSIGSSLVWYLACKDPRLARAYAPVAGGFWRPHPTRCEGPVDLLHTHGWRDQTVPLEGRPLRGGELYQGDVFEGLKLWRETGGCNALRPDAFETREPFWRRIWRNCTSGRMLELAVHPMDHDNVPSEWAGLALDWFEARLKEKPRTN